MKRIILLIIAAVAVSGCRERLSSDDRYDDLALLISPTIAGATSTQPQTSPAHTANATVTSKSEGTKAASDIVVFSKSAWATSDKIGVYLTLKTADTHQRLNFEGSTYNDLTYNNIPYVYTAGSFSTVGKYYYPYRRSQVDLWGLYPYDENLGKTSEKRNSSAYGWSVLADQSIKGTKNGAGNTTLAPAFNILQSDLLFSKREDVVPNNTGAMVDMVFRHMMNKVSVRMLVPEEFDGRKLDVSNPIQALTIMNTKVDALVDLNVDTVITTGDKPTMITAIAAGDAAPEVSEGVVGHYYYFEAITVPQLIAGGVKFIKIDINFDGGGKDAFVLTLTDDLLLRKGMKQTLDLQFDLKLGLRLNGSRIEDWGAGDGGGGLITEVVAAPSANSYVVAPGDEVIINTLIAGNDAAGMSLQTTALRDPAKGVKSAALLWQTRSGHGFGAEALVIESVDATKLKAVKVKTRAGTAGGNAVLAAYDGLNGTGNILWSWHIWVSAETIPLTSYGSKFVAANGGGKAIMDRNLGALSAKQVSGLAKTGGMLYQWGRKDPFTGARDATTTSIPVFNLAGTAVAASAGTAIAGDANFKFLTSDASNVGNAIKNPMTIYLANATSYDWTNPSDNRLWTSSQLCTSPLGVDNKGEKSIYDPCPDGYRVATGGTDGNGTWGDLGVNGGDYGTWSGAGVTTGRVFDELGGTPWYAASGYRAVTTGVLDYISTLGQAWSASPTATHAVNLTFNAATISPSDNKGRSSGFPVRCVQEANLTEHVTVVPVKDRIAAAGGTVDVTTLTSNGLGWKATLSGAAAGADGFNFGGGATTLNGTGNMVISVTVAANASSERTAKLRVASSFGTIASEITLTQATSDPHAMPAGASNSYMVAPNSSLTFNALQMKAYFSTPDATPASVQVLWQTGLNHGTAEGAANMILNTVTYDSTTGDVSVTARNGSGNAVVAAYSGANGTGTILWSWHIWVTATVGHSQALPVANQAAAGGPGKFFMDRNLGAITNAQGNVGAYGMFYQWGRKDPFTPSIGANTSNQSLGVVQVFNASGALISTNNDGLGNSFKYLASNADNLLLAIKNPMTHYRNSDDNWTNNAAAANTYWRAPATTPTNAGYTDNRGAKAIYDPCPLGYRIAANGAYEGMTGRTWIAYDKFGGTTWLGTWWPAAGYRTPNSGAFNDVGVNGYVWSSSPQSATDGYLSYFDYNGFVLPSYNTGRSYGFSVRCVQE